MSFSDEQTDYLDEALKYLDMAEKLYTGSTNHPVSQIYESKIRVLMAQGEYSQALLLLRSLPKSQLTDISLETMYRHALQRTGEKLGEESLPTTSRPPGWESSKDRKGLTRKRLHGTEYRGEEIVSEIADILGDEASLYQLAHSDPDVLAAIFKVAHRIQQEMEDSHD
jgi:hypothetical protein